MSLIDLNSLYEFSGEGRVKKDLLKTKGFNAVLVCLDAGQEIPPHPEPYEVLFIIIEGEGIITCGDDRYSVRPGNAVYVKKGEARGIKCGKRMAVVGIQEAH
jgi:quercetin dioxygenase-like cupin family protein